MALPPYGPDDFKALIPSASSSLCEKLLALPGRLATYVYRSVKWAVNSDLTATEDLKSWLGMSTSTALTAPTNVTASDGSSSSSVVVSWTASAGASYYTVYRSTGSVFSGASVVGTSTTTSYTDTTVVVDTVYTYWVTASSASATSSESASDQGYAQSSGANSRTITSSISFVSPVTGTLTCEVWAAGGDGGASGVSPFGVIGVLYPGGGGGGGEYATGAFTATLGESLDIVVDPAGTAIKRGSTVLISCIPGDDGADGYVSPGGAGGDGGTGGTFDGVVSAASRSPGDPGSAGSGSTGGAGGAAGLVETGTGTGGAGGNVSGSTAISGASGLPGKVIINW